MKNLKLNFVSIILFLVYFSSLLFAQGISLQDIVKTTKPLPKVTIYTAKEIVTLNPNKPNASAVAVSNGRILAVGSLEELKLAAGDQLYEVNNEFKDHVIVPGLIAQHDHPLLTALTMKSEIIAIEDWVLPSGTIKAAKNQQEYFERLKEVNNRMKNPDEVLFTWGYHSAFHGSLTRADLDKISSKRPIIVWHRSCHEFILNTAALKLVAIDDAFLNAMPKAAQEQSNLAEGHFWEQGMFGIISKVLPLIATPERLKSGFEFTRDYYHANGVTLACEPGGLYSKELQAAENAVFSNLENPFRFYFIPDGKSIFAAFPDNTTAETEKTLDWCYGMTTMLPKQIKLFADGAIYSLLMQLNEPYLEKDHHGEWLMNPDVFARAFKVYWDAGYQIHVHANGDAGIDMVLNNIEANMRRNPRFDHRTVVVHFAVSTKEQTERIKKLGAIVSGNPYYVSALSDMYSKVGLGPERADQMVRIGDLENKNISYSFHSDMPMAPGQPLFLMHCAVNRITMSGRVAGENQRASRLGSLKAVTIEAAYSLGLENELGSIEPGKFANFTILNDNPITCSQSAIKDIKVWGTVHEGRVLPVKNTNGGLGYIGPKTNKMTFEALELAHHFTDEKEHSDNDVCTINRVFANVIAGSLIGNNIR